MKINLLCIGKTSEKYLKTGIDIYLQRLKHYLPFKMTIVPELKKTKNLNTQQQKEQEGKALLQKINQQDYLVLLDEQGKLFTSEEMAGYLQKKMLAATKSMIFVVGGPYGFSDAIYQRADERIALSTLTFSHQMVRLIAVEQIYRALTIIKNEPYHHR